MRTKSGFSLDVSKLRKKLDLARAQLRAETFKPELADYAKKALTTASRNTPVREASTIRANQTQQYSNRINKIPSAHHLVNPSLRVRGEKEWLFHNGQWFLASEWRLPASLQNEYDYLKAERERRMQKSRSQFINERLPARFLYQKSWREVANSLGFDISQPQAVRRAMTRRIPPKNPPRGYGQWRGGKHKMAILFFNPFLEIPSRYKNFSGRQILGDALEQHLPNFQRRFINKTKRVLYAISLK